MLRREFVQIDKIDLYTKAEIEGKRGYHFPDEHGELIRVGPLDGKSLEDHLEGIEYFRRLAARGTKILPPLVQRIKNGRFKELDGFKRIMGQKKAGTLLIECFVCDPEDRGKKFRYDGKVITCKRGGQHYKHFTSPVEYGEDCETQKRGGKIIYLYKNDTEQFRLEYRENIHLHWGKAGRYRLALGRRDFDILADAFINSNIS